MDCLLQHAHGRRCDRMLRCLSLMLASQRCDTSPSSMPVRPTQKLHCFGGMTGSRSRRSGGQSFQNGPF